MTSKKLAFFDFGFRISDFKLKILLAVIVLLFASAQSYSDEDLVSKGNEYYQLRENNEDLQKAIEYYDEALKNDPKNY